MGESERERERGRRENKISEKYDKYQRQTADNTGIEKLPWRIIVSTAKTRLVNFYFLKHFLAFYAACIHKYEFSLFCQKLEAKFTPRNPPHKNSKVSQPQTVGLIFVVLMWCTPAHQHALPGMKNLWLGGHLRPIELLNLVYQTWRVFIMSK